MAIFLNSIFFIIFPITIINQFVLYLPAVAAKSVLTTIDEINSANNAKSYLISDDETFTLGFFTVDPSTNFLYLGIWYTNDDTRKVWVANKGLPPPIPPHGIARNSFGSLTIDESGTLNVIITWEGTDTAYTTMFIVSDNVDSGKRNDTRFIAVLEESGNFVLYDKSTILWQSFDHPTDTLLPGMKVGYDLTIGHNLSLTSWLTDQIPASGVFTLRLEQYQNSAQLVIYRRGKVYWSSGSLMMNNILNGFLVPDASGTYFAIPSGNTNNGISMLQLSSMGELIDGSGNFLTPKGGMCYGYQSKLSHNGCAISGLLPSCRGVSHGFEIKNGVWMNDRVLIVNDDSSNMSISDCMERCLNVCNCTGFSSSNSNGTGCQIWGGYGENYLSKDVMRSTKVSVLLSGLPKRKANKLLFFLISTIQTSHAIRS